MRRNPRTLVTITQLWVQVDRVLSVELPKEENNRKGMTIGGVDVISQLKTPEMRMLLAGGHIHKYLQTRSATMRM